MSAVSRDSIPSIGVFGGTFDPIHYGHLRTALELKRALALTEVRFVPALRSPHRDAPVADAAVRLAMVRAAIAGQAGFVADERELRRAGPSYTVDTLTELRAEHPTSALWLLLGMDAFAGLTRWHRWRELLELANIAVAHRPGWSPPGGELGTLVRERAAGGAAGQNETRFGRIRVEQVTQLQISASDLRRQVQAGGDATYLTPEEVREIITQTDCYAAPP